MKALFFAKSLLLLFILFLLTFAGHMLLPKNAFLGSITQKHDHLEKLPSPRIVLVGGSNLAFGVDSPMLERFTGLRVANMGIIVRLGLRFNLNEVKKTVGAGDLVLIMPEYRNFFRNYMEGTETLAEMAFIYPPSLTWLSSFDQYKNLAKGFIKVFKRKTGSWLLTFLQPQDKFQRSRARIYRRDGFNIQGDVITHLRYGRSKILGSNFNLHGVPYNPRAARAINRFAAAVQKRGATVLFTYPILARSTFDRNREWLEKLHRTLAKTLKIPILSTPGAETFPPDDHFFDTIYHLGRKGRTLRTKTLISRLTPHLPRRP
ncbi:hypothetical protein KKF84_17995 [Myxococcota bacterium]|nr:hypothetical protein [Myxococcota bacterium]MBU1537214.1 hypothetical protein [Myxococcota bacterium]